MHRRSAQPTTRQYAYAALSLISASEDRSTRYVADRTLAYVPYQRPWGGREVVGAPSGELEG